MINKSKSMDDDIRKSVEILKRSPVPTEGRFDMARAMTTNDKLDKLLERIAIDTTNTTLPERLKVASEAKAEFIGLIEQAVLSARIDEIDTALDKEDEDPTTHYLTDRYAKLQWLAKVQQASQKGTQA